jgi:hypothetical protein
MALLRTRGVSAVLVLCGLVLAVLPAVVMHALSAIGLAFMTTSLWGAYILGWWGLLSLLRIFVSFCSQTIHAGVVSIVGLVVGSVTVIVVLWPVLTQTAPCSVCEQPKLLAYRPDLLCVVVAAHWAFLHFKGFKLRDI